MAGLNIMQELSSISFIEIAMYPLASSLNLQLKCIVLLQFQVKCIVIFLLHNIDNIFIFLNDKAVKKDCSSQNSNRQECFPQYW